MTDLLRVYSMNECGVDEYPVEWHRTVKHLVREQAGHRCIRCGHPYPLGIIREHPRGEWTPCDEQCSHFGPGRHDPNEVDERAAIPPGYPPIIDEDGWVYFDNGDVAWLIEHGHQVEARYRILTVHHFSGIKTDLRWWNLGALCQRCHLEIQGRVQLNRPWPWQHSEWFKPYAAGFYASQLLGVDLTREQTEERLDELLAIGANHAAIERMNV